MAAFAKLLSNMKMKNQILVINLIIVIIIVVLQAAVFYFQNNEIDTTLKQISVKVLNKQNANAMASSMQKLVNYVLLKQLNSVTMLNSLNQFYQLLQRNQGFCVAQADKILNQSDAGEEYLKYPIFRYYYVNESIVEINKKPQYYENFIQLTSFLNNFQISYEFILENKIYFVDVSDQQLTSIFPTIYFNPALIPHERPSYIEHFKKQALNPEQSYSYSSVYRTVENEKNYYVYSLTKTMVDCQDNITGMTGTQLSIQDQLISNVAYNLFMTNEVGEIILTGTDQNIDILKLNYIYQENVTGFDQKDWEQIKAFTNGEQAISNCAFSVEQNIMCRFDKLHQTDMLISAYKFKETNFTIILMNNLIYQNELNEQIQRLSKDFKEQFHTQLFIFFGFSTCMVILSFLIVVRMFRPLNRIIKSTYLHSVQVGNNLQKNIFKILINDRPSTMLENLELRLQFLEDILLKSVSKKSEQCKLFEKFKYQKQTNKEDCLKLKDDIYVSMQQLQDNCKIFDPFSVLKPNSLLYSS